MSKRLKGFLKWLFNFSLLPLLAFNFKNLIKMFDARIQNPTTKGILWFIDCNFFGIPLVTQRIQLRGASKKKLSKG